MKFQRFQIDETASLKPCPDIVHVAKETYQTLPNLDRNFPVNGICVFGVISKQIRLKFQIDRVGKHVKVDFYHTNPYTHYSKPISV